MIPAPTLITSTMVHWRWITLLTTCFAIRHLDARTIQKMFLCSPSFANQNESGQFNCSLSVTGPDGTTGIQALAFSAGNNSAGGANMVNLVQSSWTIQNGSHASASSVNNASGNSPSVQSSVSSSGTSGGDLSGIGILSIPSINNIVNDLLLNLSSKSTHNPEPASKTSNVSIHKDLVRSPNNGSVSSLARAHGNFDNSKAAVHPLSSHGKTQIIQPHHKALLARKKTSKIQPTFKTIRKADSKLPHQKTAVAWAMGRKLRKSF